MNDWDLIDICTKDEYLNIDSCIEEYAKDHDDLPTLVRNYYDYRSYGNISGEYDVLASFAQRYKEEPVIKKYLGRCLKTEPKDISEAFDKTPCVITDEAVLHPSHYSFAHEPIDVIADWGLNFNLGNTVKYISRAGRKDPTKTLEDLKKARFYLDYEIEHFGEQE